MGQQRRSFGSIERRSGYFRAHRGPDRLRYESPHLFSERIDAERWLTEVHRTISREEWRPPVKVKGKPDDTPAEPAGTEASNQCLRAHSLGAES